MSKRKIEVFSAGCPACDETARDVQQLACDSCDVEVLDMRDPAVAKRAEDLGVRSVPAVAVNGRLASCCEGRGVDLDVIRAAGLGSP